MADMITIEITGAEELTNKLVAFTGGHLGQMSLHRSMGAIGLYLTRFFSGEVFASRGGVISHPWPKHFC